AFNTNILREAVRYLRRRGLPNVRLYVVGRKGRDYFRRIGASIEKDYANFFNNLSFAQAELVTSELIASYQSPDVAGVDLLYNEFKSVVQQRVVVKTLLPLPAPASTRRLPYPDFIYEPSRKDLLEALIPRFLKAQVFRALLESNAAELGARMSAMDNSTRNASELLDSMTLRLNR